MPNLVNMLKAGPSPFISRLRGGPSYKRIIAEPEKTPQPAISNEIRAEIISLKEKGISLRKILAGLDSLNESEEVKDFAKQIYYGLSEPLTKVEETA